MSSPIDSQEMRLARTRRCRRRNHRQRRSDLRIFLALLAVGAVALLVPSLLGLWPEGHGQSVAGGPAGPGASAGLTAADGYVPVGGSLSPFSSAPAVAKLDPDLRAAVRQAARAARAEGVDMRIDSGWRSARYQRELLRQAVATYGSLQVARQYVLPPSKSSHVTGGAVDIGPTDADSWMSIHGNEFGLCQIYANEMWHFQLATTPGGTCPPMSASAAEG